ncbi:MAG: divergent polysaccharide deacetylase family protein, partial [Deltaproteobacteria bacterium]|nr:divergent polysaccharide deacetylase family protein [Candidatus Deferrimicrobiaceae bacterium]
MKQGDAERQEGRTRRRMLGLLMFGAFLAGLLIVGGVFLLSGPGSPPSPDVPLPAAQAPSALPAQAVPPPPAASPPPRLAIVVDDLGYDPSRDAEWLKFPARITVAVLPFGPSSRQIAESAKA